MEVENLQGDPALFEENIPEDPENFSGTELPEVSEESPETPAAESTEEPASETAPAETEAESSDEPQPVSEAPGASVSNGRDYRGEVEALLDAHPELVGTGVPDEVIRKSVRSGKNLLAVYEEHQLGEMKAELEKLRRENDVLRTNAEAASRAPVSSVSLGGSAASEPDDPFLTGFNGE